jgi:hypothetical protein
LGATSLRNAANNGNPFAHRRLAELYERGDGVPKDVGKALFHHAIEARLFTSMGDEKNEVVASARRGSDARIMSPQDAVRVANQAKNWQPQVLH